MANSGFNADCADTEALFVRKFSGFDYIVAPSGSCVHYVRDNFDAIEQTAEVKEVRTRTFELVEFLHDIQKGRGVSVGAVPAPRRAAQQLRHAARAQARETLRAQHAVLLQADGLAFQGRWDRVRHAGATGRVLRFGGTSRCSRKSSPRRLATTRSAMPNTSSRPTAPA
jgi:hypothetical protein